MQPPRTIPDVPAGAVRRDEQAVLDKLTWRLRLEAVAGRGSARWSGKQWATWLAEIQKVLDEAPRS